MDKIRNFSIIAHIDHGKSTLADRMLEVTGTVPKRVMKEQVLDVMELERERGITIKMQPVRMEHEGYTLNLIDTPGHIDFYYEVSRALTAVEGVILLVDSTQGVQAQTLSVLRMAEDLGLVIIPVLSKIDSKLARVEQIREEVAVLLGIEEDEIITTSGKTGEGIDEVLKKVIKEIPPPKSNKDDLQALVFDFQYSDHRGVIVFVRVFNGEIKNNEKLSFSAAGKSFNSLEVGVFKPDATKTDSLKAGEIGYIVTGIKEPGVASVGDTVVKDKSGAEALSGYLTPSPVIWASVYPESQDDFVLLRQSLDRLHLSDSSLTYEEETSGVMGRGFRCGFLGMLHLEIVTERLRREFNLDLVVTTPTTIYEAEYKNGKKETVYTPSKFPDDGEAAKIYEKWARIEIITPSEYIGPIMQILHEHEGLVGESENLKDERTLIHVEMPLRELMRHFFDKLKGISSGFASISYELADMRESDVVRLDVLVAEEVIPAFSRIISRRRIQEEAEDVVDRLYKLLPKQLFVTKIQARALGRILSAKKLSALKKDVTGHLYGGDVTRKRKLWEKQKKGKKKMQKRAKANIPQDVFLKMMRGN
ncbi:MAG: translation elongation factor 4 [Candidatus Pacebacteria bacterium]|jgi:GTP-binding protein LepA|nr:elongation factor 4 [bacterium]MDP6527347.1 translation elongation factor 4 [Candidatus Paceibacterota bacterium]|tara:strand:+ start:7977 stop:9746 length:1770 start_codon:yes stop_codon:yes gene_type:complete